MNKKTISGIVAALTLISGVIAGDQFDVQIVLFDTLINFDIDFDDFYLFRTKSEFNDIYNQAVSDYENGNYGDAYVGFMRAQPGLKLDVIYSKKDIQRRLNDCKEKYTSKNIEDCKNYLKTGDINKAFELINTKNEMFLTDDARFANDINILKACCDEAVDFYSLVENDALIDAFNNYINSKYLKKNNYLNDIFVKCVNKIVETLPSKVENLLEDNLIDEALKLVNNYSEYCSDKVLINELNNKIDKHKFILKIENLEKKEAWKEIIIMINNKKDNLNNYEIEPKYENAKNKYIDQICDKIDKYKEENDFDAINYELSNTIIDCNEFQRLNEEYKDKKMNIYMIILIKVMVIFL